MRTRVMGATLKFLALPSMMIVVLFGSAGRLDLPLVWAYGALLIGFTLVAGLLVMDPALRQERLKPGPGGKDRWLRPATMPCFLAHWLIAGLDVGRFHWSDSIPTELRVAGLAGLAVSLSLAIWAIGVNPFFSPVVRIQQERGHHLVTGGPYHYVRHPGYGASLLTGLFGSLALGSLWAMVPAAVVTALLLRRTIVEDRFLQQELEGYAEYARRVRYRLAPGIW